MTLITGFSMLVLVVLFCGTLGVLTDDLRKSQIYAEDDDRLLFLERNPTETDQGHVIVEGDIAVNPEEKAAVTAASKLWPLEIKYTLSDEVDGDKIRVGLDYLMNHTCLTFTEVDADADLQEPYLRFIVGGGCWSYVGKSFSRGQSVSISSGCRSLRIVVHEVMHALGFHHEQSRSDRDSYVIILEENIQGGRIGNFNRKSADNNYSVPYDYTSTMHYSRKAFSANGLPTVITRDVRYENIIGRMGPSHNDLMAINRAYRCAAACSGECFNNGYLDESCSCVCPHGTAGTQCAQVTGQYYPDICLQDVDTAGEVESPGYPSQEVGDCYYVITAPQGQTVQLTFTDMAVKGRNNAGNCKRDRISIRLENIYTDDESGCGTEFQDQVFRSNGTIMVIKYKSRRNNGRGFQARVEFV